jgi:hypothetical protein
MKTNLLSVAKNFFKIALLVCATSVFTYCSKSDDPVVIVPPIQEQNPLEGYMTASGFSQKTTNVLDSGDYEFGYSFIPLVNGKMTAIVAKIPDVHAAMRITIWDKVAGTVLRTETLDITSSGVEVTKVISAIDLVKDKEYFITFNSNDWYDHRKTDSANVTYPFTVGDIKVTGYSYIDGTTQAMPNSPQLSYYAGDVSFKFQK